jgi:hypothetical protein
VDETLTTGNIMQHIKSQYTRNQVEFFKKASEVYPGIVSFPRSYLTVVKNMLGYSVIPVWITGDPVRKQSRGVYSLPECIGDLGSLPVSEDTRGAPRLGQALEARYAEDSVSTDPLD